MGARHFDVNIVVIINTIVGTYKFDTKLVAMMLLCSKILKHSL